MLRYLPLEKLRTRKTLVQQRRKRSIQFAHNRTNLQPFQRATHQLKNVKQIKIVGKLPEVSYTFFCKIDITQQPGITLLSKVERKKKLNTIRGMDRNRVRSTNETSLSTQEFGENPFLFALGRVVYSLGQVIRLLQPLGKI